MRTIDHRLIEATPDVVWGFAVNVERWPDILGHYRRVERRGGEPGGPGLVEMAAWRPFGPFRWPTWWRSEMDVDGTRRRISYRHVAGITRGMDVEWSIEATPDGWSSVTVIHEWTGPRWPLIGRFAADRVIGPVFIHGIASRTLMGIDRAATREGAAQ